MISKWVEFDIICDSCGVSGCNNSIYDWTDPPKRYGDFMPFSELGYNHMRKIAKSYGWVAKRNKDICPKCQVKGNPK